MKRKPLKPSRRPGRSRVPERPVPVVEERGTPVQAVVAVGPVIGRDGKGNHCLYLTMGEGVGPLFILQVDPRTGRCRQFSAAKGISGGRPVCWSERWNRLFVAASGPGTGAEYEGYLLEFDPKKARLTNRGRIGPSPSGFPCSIAEAADGSIYVGTYPRCILVRYRPDRRRFESLGRMDEADQYLYVQCGEDGTVATLVKMAHPHVVVFDPKSGTHTPFGPEADTDRQVGRVALLKRADGRLYIDSHEGCFRVHPAGVTAVDALPPPMPPATLPDGSRFQLCNEGSKRYTARELERIHPDGKRTRVPLTWTYEGTEIYLVRTGPDRKLYGSSVLPLHFFEHNPVSGKTVDRGACSTASGEIYSMDSMDGKLYFCAYTHAILGMYDPTRPWQFGSEGAREDANLRFGKPDDNPRQLGRIDSIAYRPRDMCAGPGGKVWVASVPDYGMWAGTLSWYDPKRDTFGGAHRNIYPDCSAYTMTYLPELDRLAVGFSIYGGSGTSPRAERTGFVLWDPVQDRETWRGDCGLEIVGVMDMEYAGDGLVYAIVHTRPAHVLIAHLLLLDLPRNRVVKHVRLDTAAGWPLEVSFQRDDRFLYGATRESIYRVPLGTVDLDVVWRNRKDGPSCGGALLGKHYYFGSLHRLRRARVR